jgi:hypothetical protein
MLTVFSEGCPSFTLIFSLSDSFSHIPFSLPDFRYPDFNTFMAGRQVTCFYGSHINVQKETDSCAAPDFCCCLLFCGRFQ